ISGRESAAALAAVGLPAPEPGHCMRAGPLEIVGLASDRWLAIGEETALADAARALAPHTACGDATNWRQARLMAGEAEIHAQTRGRFLPQMIGLVELGAVSFRKGCYPGQEVIARAQNLGRVKRALTLLRLDAPLEAGDTRDLEGARIEALDSVALNEGDALVQAVAPSPLPAALLASRELQTGKA
ncbi:MAG: YgfZ/GcvT domain-containing protein, partial [Gammaproteobacteria bacterium]